MHSCVFRVFLSLLFRILFWSLYVHTGQFVVVLLSVFLARFLSLKFVNSSSWSCFYGSGRVGIYLLPSGISKLVDPYVFLQFFLRASFIICLFEVCSSPLKMKWTTSLIIHNMSQFEKNYLRQMSFLSNDPLTFSFLVIVLLDDCPPWRLSFLTIVPLPMNHINLYKYT